MTVRKIYCIISAGGSGERMGAGKPKQFLELGGKPILQLTIENILKACPEAKLIVALPENQIGVWKDICALKSFNVPQIIVKGGLTRFHSVKNALEKVPDGALVMIHDGVRPFASTVLIKKLLEKAVDSEAVIPVIPLTDTIKCLERTSDGFRDSGETEPDRSRLFGAQTPQVFRSEVIKKAYDTAYDYKFTDDASVARRSGATVDYIEGEKTNIKITTPFDLEVAGLILR